MKENFFPDNAVRKVKSTNAVDVWLYCIHCERTFSCHGELYYDSEAYGNRVDCFNLWRDGRWFDICPLDDCDGSPLDFWEWGWFQKTYHPEYPITPVEGVYYPMYPVSDAGVTLHT